MAERQKRLIYGLSAAMWLLEYFHVEYSRRA